MEKMIIQVNDEGKKAIEGLCDIALKVAGLQNLNKVIQILQTLRPIPPQSAEPVPEKPAEFVEHNNPAEGK